MLASLALVVAAVPALNVALPDVATDTGATQSQLQWIVDAYALVFAGLLLPAGALGERRADVTRDYLVSLGIPADRVTIVSKGEEQPACSEENEACWQRNRRGKFIFTAK